MGWWQSAGEFLLSDLPGAEPQPGASERAAVAGTFLSQRRTQTGGGETSFLSPKRRVTWDLGTPVTPSWDFRRRPASFFRCLALARNSKCLTKSFHPWSWISLVSSLKVSAERRVESSGNSVAANRPWHLSGPQQCILCGKLAQEECLDCFEEPVFSQTGCKVFCDLCSVQVCTVSFRHALHPNSGFQPTSPGTRKPGSFKSRTANLTQLHQVRARRP